MIEIDEMIRVDSSGDWGQTSAFHGAFEWDWNHGLMERLQCRSSDDSVHLLT